MPSNIEPIHFEPWRVPLSADTAENDRKILKHYGEGAEDLLWKGTTATELEQRLEADEFIWATPGRLILSKLADFSPTMYAYDIDDDRPVVLGFDSSHFEAAELPEGHTGTGYSFRALQLPIRRSLRAAYKITLVD